MVAYICETIAHFFCDTDLLGQFCTVIINFFIMTKEQTEKKKSLARTLYMSGMDQAEIAEKVEVSRVTISKWCAAGGWKEARAAKSVTRPELVNKLLLTIDTLITQVNDSGDPDLIAGLGDKLAKLSAVIEKLDKKANVVITLLPPPPCAPSQPPLAPIFRVFPSLLNPENSQNPPIYRPLRYI